MDEESERVILFKLKLLAKQGKMVILITHNTASLDFCDKLITMEPAYA
jgi:ABC-type lipoprotein export system ATPase subunit